MLYNSDFLKKNDRLAFYLTSSSLGHRCHSVRGNKLACDEGQQKGQENQDFQELTIVSKILNKWY